jgi:hypothetical protein
MISEDDLLPKQTSPRALIARLLFTYLPRDFDLYPLTLFHNNHPPCSQHPRHQTWTRKATAHRMIPTPSANMVDPTETHEEWWRMERKQHMMEREQRRVEREQKMPEKSGGSDSLRESEAASRAVGAADVHGSREIVPATAESTPATQSNVSSVTTLAPQHTSSTPPSDNLQRVPAVTATRKRKRGREARKKTSKERRKIVLASPPHRPHQTTAQKIATSPANVASPIEAQRRILNKTKDDNPILEHAVTRVRKSEAVVATLDYKKAVPGIATSTPEIQPKDESVTTLAPRNSAQTPPSDDSQLVKKGRRDRTEQKEEQEEKELIDEIQASFTALQIASVLGSSINVPGWQPPKKKTPGVATVVLDKRSFLDSMPTASGFAFQAKPLPELKVAAIPSSINIGLLEMQTPAQAVPRGVSENLAPVSKVTPTLTPEAPNVCKVTRKQKPVTPVAATGDSNKAGSVEPTPTTHSNNKSVSMAYRTKPQAPVSNGKPAVVKKSIGPLGPDLAEVRETALVSPPTFSSSDTLASKASQALKDTGLHWTRNVFFPRFGGDNLVPISSPALKNAKSAVPSSRHVRPLKSRASRPPSALKDPLRASDSEVDSGSCVGAPLPSRSPFSTIFGRPDGSHAIPSRPLKNNAIVSALSARSDSRSGPTSTSPFAAPSPTLVRCGVFGNHSSTPPFAALASTPNVLISKFGAAWLSDANLVHFDDGYVATGSDANAALGGINLGKRSSNRADPIHLFTLPQELQDAIFGFAYTEPSCKAVTKSLWDARQDRLRKRTGAPRVAFGPPKVAEWMVSKRYFRSAAKAWVGAQASLERIRDAIEPTSSDRFSSLFCPLSGVNSALFYEFGTAFRLNMPRLFGSYDAEKIMQCRRIRYLVCLVGEEFLGETDRGFAWEVEFTDEEMVGALERVNFRLPWRVEGLELRLAYYLVYTDDEAKKAMLAANLVKLQRVMWQRKLKKPHDGTAEAEDDALYLGSEVSCAPSLPKRLSRPKGNDKKREVQGGGKNHLGRLLGRSKGRKRKRPEGFHSDLLTKRAAKRVAAISPNACNNTLKRKFISQWPT